MAPLSAMNLTVGNNSETKEVATAPDNNRKNESRLLHKWRHPGRKRPRRVRKAPSNPLLTIALCPMATR